jgi:DNA helicase II / ATP-dependent DNA helicase PcrA
VKVVQSKDRYLRVIAGAGAGKTETMTRRIVGLLARGESSGSIVAFTFTERAAKEIKERIHIRTEELLGPNAAARLGDMYVGTIHAYCMQLLQDHFGYGNYEVLDENQEMAFILREGWNLGLGPGSALAKTRNYSANCGNFQESSTWQRSPIEEPFQSLTP